MPRHDLTLITVVQRLGNKAYLGYCLRFSEFSTFGTSATAVRKKLRSLAKHALAECPAHEQWTFRIGSEPETMNISVTVAPRRAGPLWQQEVNLSFEVVHWLHGENARIAYLPALELTVVAKAQESLEDKLPKHIHLALEWKEAKKDLGRLLHLQQSQGIDIRSETISVELPTAKQAAQAEAPQDKHSVLPAVATQLKTTTLSPAYEVDDLVEKVATRLRSLPSKSVLLIGPSGVGKTAIVHEIARRPSKHRLGQKQFWETTGARLAMEMHGTRGMEQTSIQLCEEAGKANAILHLGNLAELNEVGKHEHNTISIAMILAPHLKRGELHAMAECTPEQASRLELHSPGLLQAFEKIEVTAPSPDAALQILHGRAIEKCPTVAGPPFEDEAIATLDRLHRRFATYSAYPGRAIRFLESLRDKHLNQGNLPVTVSKVTDAFARETGLPLLMIDDELPLDLESTRAWFAERVLGQSAAIDLLLDQLATIKAGLARPRRPIASFLFAGPTGVGKTEMAKTLASFLFGNSDRIIRFDMSEYQDPIAVQRLIGSSWQKEGVMTARVREQPFSIVLLDEFEKADPSFYDLLLQILGEGKLTDAMGRTADFCNSVIIMTSNLGAEAHGKASMRFATTSSSEEEVRESEDHFEEAVRRFLRPEIYNRLDRVMAFHPLGAETIRKIASSKMRRLWQRDGLSDRDLDLDLDPLVTDHLATIGFHPRYGARYLERTIERELLTPLASCLNRYPADTPLTMRIWLDNENIQIKARTRQQNSPQQDGDDRLAIVHRCISLRRDVQAIQRCEISQDLQDEIFEIHRLEQIGHLNRSSRQLERLSQISQLADQVAAIHRQASTLEVETRCVLCEDTNEFPIQAAALVVLDEELARVRLSLFEYAMRVSVPSTIAIFPIDDKNTRPLIAAYEESLSGISRYCQYSMVRGSGGGSQFCLQWPMKRLDADRHDAKKYNVSAKKWMPYEATEQQRESPPCGVGFELTTPRDCLLMMQEVGTHRFVATGNQHLTDRVRVLLDQSPIDTYRPPDEAYSWNSYHGMGLPDVREYEWDKNQMSFGSSFRHWKRSGFATSLNRLLEDQLDLAIKKALSSMESS